MSDHTHHTVSRSDGVSGRGILSALAVVLGIIIVLAVVGSINGGDGTATQDAIAPATQSPPALPTE